MSETFPETPADPLNEALVSFAGCIGEAFTDVCSYSLIIGQSYVPFAPDPEDEDACEDEDCSQVWVRVTSVNPTPSAVEGWDESCALTLDINLEVGIIRCMEVMEDGEAPTASSMLAYAVQAMEDMKTIMCASLGCEVWAALDIGQWSPLGPMGGEYGGMWTMTAQLA